MLREPKTPPHIPVQGLTGWAESAAAVGRAGSQLLRLCSDSLKERETVNRLGGLADFSGKLQQIEQETRRDLEETDDVRDWEYAWREASEARIAEAVAELPAEARAAGRANAAVFSAQAAARAWRDRELKRIDGARAQWQQRLDAAVAAGDEAEARRWLEQGRGVFVPEADMENADRRLTGRLALGRWTGRVQQDAAGALADYRNAPPETLPPDETDATELRTLMERTEREARADLADTLRQNTLDGVMPDAGMLQRAEDAGLITAEHRQRIQQPIAEAPAQMLSAWWKRVDTCPADAEAVQRMKLELGTSGLPEQDRRELYRRLDMAAGVNADDRLALCNELQNLYERGAFGCPGDTPADGRLLAVQKSALPLLAEQGSDAVAQWLANFRRSADRLICFTPHRKK